MVTVKPNLPTSNNGGPGFGDEAGAASGSAKAAGMGTVSLSVTSAAAPAKDEAAGESSESLALYL